MCVLCQGSDKAYLTNVHTEFESHPDFVKGEDRRRWDKEFGIRHYAGTVLYNIPGFVVKNKDVQLEEERRLREEEQSKERHNSFASLADMSSM